MKRLALDYDERLVVMTTPSTDRQITCSSSMVVETVDCGRCRPSHRCPAVISLSISRVRLVIIVVLTLTALTTAMPRPSVSGTATKVRMTSTVSGYRRRDLSLGGAVVIGGNDSRWPLSRNANQVHIDKMTCVLKRIIEVAR